MNSNDHEIINLTRDEIKERQKLKKIEENKRLFQECRDGVVNPNYKLRISKSIFGDVLIVSKGRKNMNNLVEFKPKVKK